jgi:hypothetical protein
MAFGKKVGEVDLTLSWSNLKQDIPAASHQQHHTPNSHIDDLVAETQIVISGDYDDEAEEAPADKSWKR